MTEHSSGTVRVGVVVPAATPTVLLRRTLESLSGQTHANWSAVICTADGSAAAEATRIAGVVLGEPDPRLSVLDDVGGAGHGAAVNAGLAALDTALAVVLRPGEAWSPDFLSVTTVVLAHRQAVVPGLRGVVTGAAGVAGVVTGPHLRIDAVTDWTPAGAVGAPADGVFDIRGLLAGNPFPASAFLFDREAALELGGHDAALPVGSEWDFHLRYCLAHDLWHHAERLAFHLLPEAASDADPDDEDAALYRAMLSNRWIRRAGPGALGLMQRPGGLDARAAGQGATAGSRPTAEAGRAVPSLPAVGKPKKGPVKRALSDLNRLRKRWI